MNNKKKTTAKAQKNSEPNTRPACINKWQNSFLFEDKAWSSIFTLAFRICKCTKLQSFQYRLLHRIITCNHWLFIVKVTDTPSCKYCKLDETDVLFSINPYSTVWGPIGPRMVIFMRCAKTIGISILIFFYFVRLSIVFTFQIMLLDSMR